MAVRHKGAAVIIAGLRLDEQGVTARAFWRTYKYRWPEVSHFSDGSWDEESGRWILQLVLRDGLTRYVAIRSTADLDAIQQYAAPYGVPVRRLAEMKYRIERRKALRDLTAFRRAMVVRNKGDAVIISPGWHVGSLVVTLIFYGLGAWWLLGTAWVRHSSASVIAVVVTALAVTVVFTSVRMLLPTLRLDGRGVTINNFWRTYKIRWADVSHLGDGLKRDLIDREPCWAFAVVLRDGRTRIVPAVEQRGADLDALRQYAARHNVRTYLAKLDNGHPISNVDPPDQAAVPGRAHRVRKRDT